MDYQAKVDRINESAMDLVRTMAIEMGVDLSDPMTEKMVMLGVRAGSIATFEYVQRDWKL